MPIGLLLMMNNNKKILLISYKLIGIFIIFVVFLLIFLPLPKQLTNPSYFESIKVLDRNSKLLYTVRQDNYGVQYKVKFSEIPKNIVWALISIEDRDFYSHIWISFKAILRAAYLNIVSWKIVSGWSTITQQLVRNRLMPDKRDLFYKLKEIYFAIRLNGIKTKNEILEEYLNNTYFWHQAYGINAAADIYFGKKIEELSLAQVSLLVGLLQSPNTLDPYKNYKAAIKRSQKVLLAMSDIWLVSDEQYNNALKEPIKLDSGRVEILAPHFVNWLISIEDNIFKSKEVITTIDSDLQREIETIIQNELKKLEDKNVSSAAVVVIDVKSGELLSMIWSAAFWNKDNDGQVNVATSPRQPGSALKPFTYALALKQGDSAATTVADIETQFFTQEWNPYIPRNYNYGYHGLVRYREALANSYNISAVKVLEKVWVSNLLNFLKDAGIQTLNKSPEYYWLALTLGDWEVKLLELAQAYWVFARQWKTLPIKIIKNHSVSKPEQILDSKIAWIISDILSDNDARLPEFWVGSVLNFDFPVAVKTWTTRNSRDNWTMGFTQDRIVWVWVWNADNAPMRWTSWVTGAGPIFRAVMLAAMKNIPKRDFIKPSWINEVQICALSGKLPGKNCSNVVTEFFIKGSQPKEEDDIFQKIPIDLRNGLLWYSCEDKFIKEEVFAVFPLELQSWAVENGWQQAPKNSSQLCQNSWSNINVSNNILEITQPNNFDSFKLDPLVPDENEKIIFKARSNLHFESVDWFVDDEFVWSAKDPNYRFEWLPSAWKHKIIVRSWEVVDSVSVEVFD